MLWIEIAAGVVVGYLILKFVVKPLFKIIGIILLVLIVWWMYNGF